MPDLIERTFLERETISFLEQEPQLLSGKIAELLTAVGDSLKIGCVWMLENPGDGFAYTFPLTVEIGVKRDQYYSVKLVAKVKASGILLNELISMPCLLVPESIAIKTEDERKNA